MLILLVQNVSQSKSEMDGLLAFLATKIPNVSVNLISREEVVDVILDDAETVLIITQENSIATFLSKKGNEVLVWYDLPDLSVKLDMYLQLHRRLSQFPLPLKNWRMTEVLHNCDDSIVYHAVNHHGKEAAIKRFKFLPSSLTSDLIDCLIQRLEKYCGADSKGLVHYYEGGTCNNAFYLVMEYLKFGTLRQALDGCGNHLPLTHALEWFQEIVIALNCVHKAGLIHRDLKIDNILMRADGSLALTDFGVSKRILLDSGFVHEQELHCSPHYVSPEQISGDACSKASDIYSLGVIFYELLTGRKPYSAKQVHELMMHHVMAPVPILPNEFSQFQGMIDKMMAKNPKDRYSSALDAIDSLPIAA